MTVQNHVTPGRRRRPVEERRAQIVNAAISLFAEYGYHQVTVQDVADRAGVSVGLIYRIAESKQVLLLRSIDGILDAYDAVLPAALEDDGTGAGARLYRGFGAYCRVIDSRRDQALLAYAESRTLNEVGRATIKARELAVNGQFAHVIDAGIDSGAFRPDVDPDLAAYDLIILGHMWALKHWAFRGRFTIDTYIDRQFELFLTSVARSGDGAAPEG